MSELGPPSVFITVMFNKNWPEVGDKLLEGQSIFMRPDVATQIFKARLDALVHNLQRGKYFGGAEVVYIMRVRCYIIMLLYGL